MAQKLASTIARTRPMHLRLGGHFAAHIADDNASERATQAISRLGPGATVTQRCAALGVRLTEKRRRLVEILDVIATPIDLEAVHRCAAEQGVDINRSTLHRLIADLVAAGVLEEIGSKGRRARYSAPLPMVIEIIPEGFTPFPVADPNLAAALFECLERHGISAANMHVAIALVGEKPRLQLLSTAD